jgi:DoxX-like protein
MNIFELFKPLRLSPRVSAGLLILRLVAGLAFVFHGYGKITKPFAWMPPEAAVPSILQGLAALSEFGRGLAWILGPAHATGFIWSGMHDGGSCLDACRRAGGSICPNSSWGFV